MISIEPGVRAAAFRDGCAPVLARGAGGRVAAVVTAERAPWYMTILYALLLFRRDHELEPLHEDVVARALMPAEHLGGYDGLLIAQDLDQLAAWGAIERITEAHKLRSYRDNRRERFRYRLTDDAVALLEWLEARLAAKLEGRVGDSRDRLVDVVGHLRELRRALDAWRGDSGGADLARRALYLVEACGDAIDEVGAELLAFRGEMLGFASRPYDLAALGGIIDWLERYVAVYVRRVEELRTEIAGLLRQLRAPRHAEALVACLAVIADERAAGPRALRATALAAPAERLAAHASFFAPSGVLADLCARIDESARAVVLKMRRHLRELERRNARLGDLRAAIRRVAAGPALDVRRAELGVALVATAHARLDRRPATAEHRVLPPLPRGHVRTAPSAVVRPIARKKQNLDALRELAARRRALLGAWLGELLGDQGRALLSSRALDDACAPATWMRVARAWHLDGGRALREVGFALSPSGGEAVLGGEAEGMAAPDVWIERNAPRSR